MPPSGRSSSSPVFMLTLWAGVVNGMMNMIHIMIKRQTAILYIMRIMIHGSIGMKAYPLTLVTTVGWSMM